MKLSRVLLAIVMMVAVAASANAEVFENMVIQRVDIDTDKNGAEYVRLIVPLDREEGGIKYTKTVAAMCFGADLANYAKGLKPGDTVTFAGDLVKFRGRESINIHGFAQ